MLYGKELVKSIQKRSKIQPGDLVVSPAAGENGVPKIALVMGLSSSCKFDRDYDGAEDHIFYKCEPADGSPTFVDYVCNLRPHS